MAIEIGKFNHLEVIKVTEQGLYLDAYEEGSVLLPNRYVPDGLEVGDQVDVFLYFYSDDLLIATTETPKAQPLVAPSFSCEIEVENSSACPPPVNVRRIFDVVAS